MDRVQPVYKSSIVCTLESLFPLLPYSPLILAWAVRRADEQCRDWSGRNSLLVPCPTKEPWTIALLDNVSLKVILLTIAFSSTTILQATQMLLPAAVSYSRTVPLQSFQEGYGSSVGWFAFEMRFRAYHGFVISVSEKGRKDRRSEDVKAGRHKGPEDR
jgi:hypothetical protein